ncbi:MAG: hypothetical protein N2D54_12315 [Chloroflexota bacterium]
MFISKKVLFGLSVLLFGLLASTSQAATAAPAHSSAKTGSQAIAMKYITIPAANFIPGDNSVVYDNSGLHLSMGSGSGLFTAGFSIPHNKTIKNITLFAIDENGGSHANVCASIYVTKPADASEVEPKEVCTQGSSPSLKNIKRILSKQISHLKGTYIWLRIGGTDIKLYGVRIGYK